ncbi:hypothetical protein Tco_1391180 [Tanacetum coccineum]
MAGLSEGGGPQIQDDREGTPPPLTKEQIKGHVSALRSIIKDHNMKNKINPIQIDFDEENIMIRDTRIVKGKEVVDDDLRKPFKEALKTPLTHRIIEFAGPEYKMPANIKLYDGTTDLEDHLGRFASAANSGEWPMLVWCRMFQQTLDGPARGWFERLPANSIDEWADLREAFTDRWTVETGFIMVVPEVMKISSFTDSLKCPELAKRFSDKAPTTVTEMIRRLDDFIHSEKPLHRLNSPKEKRESNTGNRIFLHLEKTTDHSEITTTRHTNEGMILEATIEEETMLPRSREGTIGSPILRLEETISPEWLPFSLWMPLLKS